MDRNVCIRQCHTCSLNTAILHSIIILLVSMQPKNRNSKQQTQELTCTELVRRRVLEACACENNRLVFLPVTALSSLSQPCLTGNSNSSSRSSRGRGGSRSNSNGISASSSLSALLTLNERVFYVHTGPPLTRPALL